MSTVLVTGGCGYIGSHTALCLAEAGHQVVVLDNLCNSSEVAIERVRELTGRPIDLVVGDIRDTDCLRRVFVDHFVDAVMHFAGLKAVGESVERPLAYYENNVGGTIALLEAMCLAGVRQLVFSSSATVYGDPERLPVTEQMPADRATNSYGRNKSMIESILSDLGAADPDWCVAVLRYFNPVGAHPSGRIGEDPLGVPNNLSPYIARVAVGALPALPVYGNDYETIDGTGVRDYIHVMDLAEGHLAALDYLKEHRRSGVWNLGTGRGVSVLEMVDAFRRVSGRPILTEFKPRRDGDIAACWADPSKASRELHWSATRGLDAMVEDTWRWQSANPGGYNNETQKQVKN